MMTVPSSCGHEYETGVPDGRGIVGIAADRGNEIVGRFKVPDGSRDWSGGIVIGGRGRFGNDRVGSAVGHRFVGKLSKLPL